MMSLRLQIIIISCMLLVGIYIIHLMRKKRMDFRFALAWLFIDLCICVLTVWPILLNKIAMLLGIASPMNMLFFLGFCFAVKVIFSLSLEASRLSDKVKKLSQEIAIIRKDSYDEYHRLEEQQERQQ